MLILCGTNRADGKSILISTVAIWPTWRWLTRVCWLSWPRFNAFWNSRAILERISGVAYNTLTIGNVVEGGALRVASTDADAWIYAFISETLFIIGTVLV